MTAPHIAAARARQEPRLRDTCRFTREGESQFDPATGQITGAEMVVYDGPCTVVDGSTSARTSDAGGIDIDLDEYLVKVPTSATGIRDGDDGRVTPGEGSDPDLADIPLRVERVGHRSTAVLRQVVCVDQRRVVQQ